MLIRSLDPLRDQEALEGLHRRLADYILLEWGREPDASLVGEYFDDAPPGGDPATSLKLGLFESDELLGVADMAFGYPERHDAYIGRMLLAQAVRGQGLGLLFLRHLEQAARARGATRLLLTVLAVNPRGRSFWEREGFGRPMEYPPTVIGNRTHACTRLEKPL